MRPIALQRARFGRHSIYTPKESRAAKQTIAWRSRREMFGKAKFEGPVALSVIFCFLKAQKTRKELEQFPAKKPDLDNLIKLVTDALNGVVYVDDAQIVHLSSSKIYGPSEGLLIEVKEV